MIWLATLVYYSIWMTGYVLVFQIYGFFLLICGRQGWLVRNLGGLIIYAIVSCFIALPHFIAFEYLDGVLSEFDKNEYYIYYYVLCYAISLVPGLLYFKKKFLSRLRRLGYF